MRFPLGSRLGLEPGPRRGGFVLERVDGGLLFHGETDVVEPVQQAMLAEWIDVELDAAAVGTANLLRLEIDRERGVGAALGIVQQLLEIIRRDADRQDAVLEAVVVEDVGEARRDDAADAEIEQRPRRMLTRGA